MVSLNVRSKLRLVVGKTICFIVFMVSCAGAAFAAGLTPKDDATPGSSHDYHRIQQFLQQLHAQYPQGTEIFSLGTSGTGESIDGIKIGHGPIHHLIVGTHHGNEYGATEVAVGAAADLAKSPIPNQTIFVIPVLNISGFDTNRREESLVGSGDDNTVDANRDYPGPCGTEGPFRLTSTKALADLVDRENIVASATLHTFKRLVAYPWGFATQDLSTPYDQQFIDLATLAATFSHNEVGNSTSALYAASGTFEDYAFWKHGVWSLLFELGSSHTPDPSEVEQLVAENVPGLRKMMEGAPTERAQDHAFHGKCDSRQMHLDLHNE
jgi:hypothetical protein